MGAKHTVDVLRESVFRPPVSGDYSSGAVAASISACSSSRSVMPCSFFQDSLPEVEEAVRKSEAAEGGREQGVALEDAIAADAIRETFSILVN